MKLRIRGNSLRLRLTKTEVDKLANTHRVEEKTSFALGDKDSLVYVLEACQGVERPTAFIEGHRIVVALPLGEVTDWASSEQVGIEYNQALDEEKSLKILVEKDFACLKPREGEDDSDSFPHPEEGTGEAC